MSVTSKIKNKLGGTLDLWRSVFLLLRYSGRSLGIAVFGLTLAEIILTVGGLLMIKTLIEKIAAAEDPSAVAPEFFGYILLILGVFLASRVAAAIGNYYRSAQGYVVTDYVNQAIQERAVDADLSFYDTSLYYDNLQRARQAGAGRPAQVVANALNVLRGGLLLGAIVIVIAALEWIVLPLGFVVVALIMVVQIRFTRERFERQRAIVAKERKSLYADFLMTSEPFAKEIRLWHLGGYLRDMYMQLRDSIRVDYLSIERRKTLSEVLVSVAGTLLFLVATGFMLYRFSTGAASLSDLVIVIVLLLRAEMAGRSFVTALSRLYDDQLYLSQIFSFLNLETKIASSVVDGVTPVPDGGKIKVENVTFSYPGAERPALENVSLTLEPGRFTALVGGNGSGKTTLIKLLCRLYDPDKGRIFCGDTDVRQFDPLRYRQQFSVIFQDFVQFAFSGADNLSVADLGKERDSARMVSAAQLSGADKVFEDLPKGYDTILSRMFDGGVELSGGQWQKTALARAFFPRSKFIILDEPTSAIDPNAEAALFEGFRDKLDGRGALVISHRLSTIRMADYTYVLENGKIVEEGTHEKLITDGGIYAKMFERQGRGYRS